MSLHRSFTVTLLTIAVALLAAASASAGTTVLTQVVDDHYTTNQTTPDARYTITYGNPYWFGFDGPLAYTQTGSNFSSNAKTAYVWAVDVSRFFCAWRNFCGRDGGQPGPGWGTFDKVLFTVNWQPPSPNVGARYVRAHQRIYVSRDAANAPGIIAHEFGHQIDYTMRNDYTDTVESQEVSEALGDMFGYDYERGIDRPDVLHPTITDCARNPTGCGFRNTYLNYDCRTTNQHYNGWILTYVYTRIADTIGRDKAGALLQGIPWALPAKRTFGSVRDAFLTGARYVYGYMSTEYLQIAAAFTKSNIQSGSTRANRCPGYPA